MVKIAVISSCIIQKENSERYFNFFILFFSMKEAVNDLKHRITSYVWLNVRTLCVSFYVFLYDIVCVIFTTTQKVFQV